MDNPWWLRAFFHDDTGYPGHGYELKRWVEPVGFIVFVILISLVAWICHV